MSERPPLFPPLKLRRSAGVPVTGVVRRHLTEGDRARDDRAWAAAAVCYRQALALDPGLVHIWIQLGHALKESGAFTEAELAYRRAEELDPASAEPHLHLGHLRKLQGNRAGAGRSYLRALQLQPGHGDASDELRQLAARSGETDLRLLAEAVGAVETETDAEVEAAVAARRIQADIRRLVAVLRDDGDPLEPAARQRLAAADAVLSEIERLAAEREAPADPLDPALVFDVSDLIAYFQNARLPTGIQRVQIETISAALEERAGRAVKICCFLDRRDDWLEIAPSLFLRLCRLSLADGDRAAPDWLAGLARLRLALDLAEPMAFPPGAFLINLGTSWWLRNYFLMVRQAKRRFGIRYTPFVHDLIPVMAPEHCTRELTQDFVSWTIGVFEHADFFLVNSEATRRDLKIVADFLDHPVDDEKIAVVRLDAEPRRTPATAAASAGPERWGLGRSPFVLFVSTIESRKDHVCAFDAWTRLLKAHGPRRVPRLVCVGAQGWLNDAVHARLAANAALRDHVVMLSGLSDAELGRLYRDCLFTLYPSLYEGWGLPVTESLCHGKVPVISDASSLPEAGGEFAVYFEAGSPSRLAEALEGLIFDHDHRAACERRIADGFTPRAWRDIAGQIAGQARWWAASPAIAAPPLPPTARLGAYFPLVRNVETKLWPGLRSAESFRVGDGWWGPEDWGCWTKPQGGLLEIGLPARHPPLRAYWRLRGLPGRSGRYRLEVAGAVVEGRLGPGEFKWVTIDAPAAGDDQPVLHAHLTSDDVEDLADGAAGLDMRTIAVGLAGFFLCGREDAAARADFLEAVTLGDHDGLAFHREPVGTFAPLIAPARTAPERLVSSGSRP